VHALPAPTKTWKTHPAYFFVLELLEKKKGSMADTDLLGDLTEEFPDLGFRDMNELLMRLEVAGKISLTTMARGKRRIELKA
jgi:hypothetical protein